MTRELRAEPGGGTKTHARRAQNFAHGSVHCEGCGRTFRPLKWGTGALHYCSPGCRTTARGPRLPFADLGGGGV